MTRLRTLYVVSSAGPGISCKNPDGPGSSYDYTATFPDRYAKIPSGTMASHLAIERYVWFDRQVRNGRYPNATTLAARFETSRKTAQRCIDFMRDRLRAPLEYDQSEKGYFYTEQGFELPSVGVSQEEILAVVVAKKLLADASGGLLGQDLTRFADKLFAGMGDLGLPVERLDRAFSAVWPGASPAPENVFRAVLTGLINQNTVAFDYLPPSSSAPSRREAEPYHLQHYQGTWVLIAFCRDRREFRTFSLARMHNPAVTGTTFRPRPVKAWQHLVEGAYGIFRSETTVPAVLRFNAFRAPWIREQIWHRDQRIEELEDGGLVLTVPVSDFREIKLKILQFGSDVEVLAPDELRREIAEEAEKLAAQYRKP